MITKFHIYHISFFSLVAWICLTITIELGYHVLKAIHKSCECVINNNINTLNFIFIGYFVSVRGSFQYLLNFYHFFFMQSTAVATISYLTSFVNISSRTSQVHWQCKQTTITMTLCLQSIKVFVLPFYTVYFFYPTGV